MDAIVPFALGLIAGAVDLAGNCVLDSVPSITIPFISFAVVTAILAPIVASWVLKKSGGVTFHDPVAENVAAA